MEIITKPNSFLQKIDYLYLGNQGIDELIKLINEARQLAIKNNLRDFEKNIGLTTEKLDMLNELRNRPKLRIGAWKDVISEFKTDIREQLLQSKRIVYYSTLKEEDSLVIHWEYCRLIILH